jgi:aminopeptidase N
MRDGRIWTMQEPFGALTWYPVNDHPSDKARYDVTIHAPGHWVGVFNGELQSRSYRHRVTTTVFHLGAPSASYLTTIAIGPYRHISDVGPHGLPISYWVPRDGRRHLRVLRETPSMLRWLESRLGRYPFSTAGVVLVPSASAMETQTLVTMGTGIWGSQGSRSAAFDLLHEYAHQWYGDSVTPDNWPDLWMNESFAMYIQISYEASHGGAGLADWWRHLRHNDNAYRATFGPPGAYDKHQFASINVYYCGALMLHELRKRIGAATFARVLRAWPQRHRFSDQNRRRWIRFLHQQTGRRLGPFVTRWLMSPTTPG